MKQQQRPVNLNLTTIKFPPPAIVSILHRVTGVLIFLLLPFLLWVLSTSVSSQTGFLSLKDGNHPILWFFVWIALSATIFHLIAGVRHLFMDLGYGESKQGGRATAYMVMILSLVGIIAAGVWLW